MKYKDREQTRDQYRLKYRIDERLRRQERASIWSRDGLPDLDDWESCSRGMALTSLCVKLRRLNRRGSLLCSGDNVDIVHDELEEDRSQE